MRSAVNSHSLRLAMNFLEPPVISPPPLVRVQVLGPISITDGSDSTVAPLLTQPRRVAVLAYLILARPRGLHSRDTLVAMLWPEADQAGGRHALRNVLHAIRQAVGGEVLTVAGDGMVGVNFDRVLCDAIELERDLSEGRVENAIARYQGELLQGFHVNDAPEFERWLDAQRRRVTELVLGAAWSLADSKRLAGEVDGALQAARRAAAIAPDDEISLRRFLSFLDDAGDRFGAVRAYEEFAARLRLEYGAEPSAETQDLVRELRERTVGKAKAERPQLSALHPPSPQTGEVHYERAATEKVTAQTPRHRPRRLLWGGIIAAFVVLIIFAAQSFKPTPIADPPSKLLVLPMENETGDSSLAYVGSGLADGIARRLEGIGGITVRSGARSDWPPATRHDFRELGRQFGSVILLRTSLHRAGDSLEVRASVLDLASSRERQITASRFTTRGLRDMESELAASVAGAVFRVPLPVVPREANRPIDPESYRLMLAGFHEQATKSKPEASKELFLAAIRADPLNARAWSGLSSALLSDGIVGENLDAVEAAAGRALALDSLQGAALANIGLARAFRYRNLADGLDWVRRAIKSEPSNPKSFFVLGVLYRHAWMWDEAVDAFRIARQLDPLSAVSINREAAAELCARRPERALPLFRRQSTMSETDTSALTGLSRSYAALGRYDEAIAELRKSAIIVQDSALITLLKSARGKSGYLAAKHAEGRRRLAAVKRRRDATLRLMQADFAAGEDEAGFAELETLIRERSVALYRLPCMPDLDEVRNSPRYAAALKRIGPLPLR